MQKQRDVTLRIVVITILLAMLSAPAIAASTQLHIVKYAGDGSTILNETTVDFQWMETNLPVYGNGVTHYYMQGPCLQCQYNG